MWHLLVLTRTGAKYLFRYNMERVYLTVTGSSSGASLENKLVHRVSVPLPWFPKIPGEQGPSLVVRSESGALLLRSTPIVYWEIEPVHLDLPTITSHDILEHVM